MSDNLSLILQFLLSDGNVLSLFIDLGLSRTHVSLKLIDYQFFFFYSKNCKCMKMNHEVYE